MIGGKCIMGDVGIEIDTVAGFQQVFVFAMEKAHGAFENQHHLLWMDMEWIRNRFSEVAATLNPLVANNFRLVFCINGL